MCRDFSFDDSAPIAAAAEAEEAAPEARSPAKAQVPRAAAVLGEDQGCSEGSSPVSVSATASVSAGRVVSRAATKSPPREAHKGIARVSTPPPSPGMQDRRAKTLAAMRTLGMKIDGSKAPKVLLPADSEAWSSLEVNLFLLSGGVYDPSVMARRRRVPETPFAGTGVSTQACGRVSIVAPTMSSRQHYHESLWACFEAQTWEDKELIVLETYEQTPSEFLRRKAEEDERFVHVCIQRKAGRDFTVGLKRNMTLHLASGEYIVNFDDDDLYASNYIETMIGEMQRKDLQGLTLSSWYNYYVEKGVCTFSDPVSWGDWADDQKALEKILYGYGFSYAHRRWAALDHCYPNVAFAEDAPFFLKLREVFGSDRVSLKKDDEGICMHIMHKANSAQVLASSEVALTAVRALPVAALKPFQKYLDAAPQWGSILGIFDKVTEWLRKELQTAAF